MLRLDPALERSVGPAARLHWRLPRNVTHAWWKSPERPFATSTFGTPYGVGCHSVRREYVKRREIATLKAFLADAQAESHALAVLAAPLLQGPSATGGPQRITTQAQTAGQSIMRQFNVFGAKKDSGHGPWAQPYG
jgi:hypothetical protein